MRLEFKTLNEDSSEEKKIVENNHAGRFGWTNKTSVA